MNNSLMTDRIHCTGCSACAAICPLHCVSVEKDAEGFYKATVDNAVCVKCGKCNTVCPLQSLPQRSSGLRWMAAITKDKNNYQRSTSGGAFFEICRSITDLYPQDKIYYFGAAWDNKTTVVHKYVDTLDEVVIFQKSKYIQSDVKKTFPEVKDFLNAGNVVVYSGTPCQIAGLRKFIKETATPDQKLFLIDFICHGVGSPAVFAECLSEMETRHNDTVHSYSFRWKVKRFFHVVNERYMSHVVFDSGMVKNIWIDDYNKTFLSQLCLNSSCAENCKFRSKERCSDFTIADFNGFAVVFPAILDGRHYSTVIVNTKQALTVLDRLQKYMDILSCKCSDVEKYQTCYNSIPKGNAQRDAFFCCFLKKEAVSALIKNFNLSFEMNLKSKIRMLLPYWVLFFCRKIKRNFFKQ